MWHLKRLHGCGSAASIGGAVHAFPFPPQQEKDKSAKKCSQTSKSVRYLSFFALPFTLSPFSFDLSTILQSHPLCILTTCLSVYGPAYHPFITTCEPKTQAPQEREREKSKDRAYKKSTEMSADSWKREMVNERSRWKKKWNTQVRCQQCCCLIQWI